MIEDGNAVTVRDLFVIQEENDYEEDLRRRRVVLAFK